MNKKSFTLIELLVVIAIIGILSSLVIARFSNWSDNARIANTLQWSAGIHRTLGANLVGHWPLNEGSGTTFNDISGYGNHGSCNLGEGYCPSWVEDGGIPGTGNPGLEFDGTDDYVGISNLGAIFNSYEGNQSIVTYSLWFNSFESLPGTGIIGLIDTWDMYLYLRDENNIIRFRNGDAYSDTSSGVYRENQWHHLIGVANDGILRTYVDSNLVKELIVSNTDLSLSLHGTKTFTIGRASSQSSSFAGAISEVRIYNTALTAEEVSRIYAESKDKYLAYE